MGARVWGLCTLLSGIVALHPLDPLSTTEIENAVKCCRWPHVPRRRTTELSNGRHGCPHRCRTSYAPSYRVYAINLAVPPKSDVLSWESSGGVTGTPPRAAVLWLRESAATSLWEVIVSTGDACTVVGRRQVQNVQPPMRGNSGEMYNASTVVMSDPRVLSALAARMLKPEEVTLDFDSVGNYPGDVGTSPREAIFEFYAAGGSNWCGRAPMPSVRRTERNAAATLRQTCWRWSDERATYLPQLRRRVCACVRVCARECTYRRHYEGTAVP